MRYMVGIWHNELVLLTTERLPGRWELAVDEEKDVSIFAARPSAGGACSCGSHGGGAAFDWIVRQDYDTSRLVRCSQTEVYPRERTVGRFTILFAELPPAHLLPWPHVRDCERYLSAEELMRECWLRKCSAVEAGCRVPAPPGYVTRRLTPAMRIELFSAAGARP